MKINSIGGSAIQIQIDGEDYSVADIVHKELLNVKHVKFAGVAPPHPLIKTLTLQIHTDGADANKVLDEALDNSKKKVSELLDVARQVFPFTRKAVEESVSATEMATVGEQVTSTAESGSSSENITS